MRSQVSWSDFGVGMSGSFECRHHSFGRRLRFVSYWSTPRSLIRSVALVGLPDQSEVNENLRGAPVPSWVIRTKFPVVTAHDTATTGISECPRRDSNPGTWLRRPMLYPLSYEGFMNSLPEDMPIFRSDAVNF